MRKYAGMRSIACLAICGVLMTSMVSPEAATLKVKKQIKSTILQLQKDRMRTGMAYRMARSFWIIRAMCALHIIPKATL